MRILVTGATGYVGSRLVTTLLKAGHQVLAATRNPHRLNGYGWNADVRPVLLDATHPADVPAVLTAAGPIDVLYYLIHNIGQPDYRAADNAAAAAVAAAASSAGARRIVYLGGFRPRGPGVGTLSEHLASRAEVADALYVDGGADLVCLGAAMILGAGSTSFEMLRYVGDRFPLLPKPSWMDNPIDPISIRDVLYYLVAAADVTRVPAGAYDICGPDTTSYQRLLTTYARASGSWRAGLPVRGLGTEMASVFAGIALPVPHRLAGNLVESMAYPMRAADTRLSDVVADPPGGLVTSGDAIARALARRRPRPVNALADPHQLADTDPVWAGGDTLRIRRLIGTLTPPMARPTSRLVEVIPRPLAGAIRTGLETLISLTDTINLTETINLTPRGSTE